MDYVTRGVCGQEGCRERRYYLDNGLWFCRRGHLQEVCMSLSALRWFPHPRTMTSHKAGNPAIRWKSMAEIVCRVDKLKRTPMTSVLRAKGIE